MQEYESIDAIKELFEPVGGGGAGLFDDSLCGKTFKVLNKKGGDGKPSVGRWKVKRRQEERANRGNPPRVFYQMLMNSSQDNRNTRLGNATKGGFGKTAGVAPFMKTSRNQLEELRKTITKAGSKAAGKAGVGRLHAIHRAKTAKSFCDQSKCMMCGYPYNHKVANPSSDRCCLDEIL